MTDTETTAPRVTFRAVEPKSWQHAVTDRKPARRYEVLIDGSPVGEVRSRSRESWDLNPSGRIRTRMRGYTRTWEAHRAGDPAGRPVTWEWTRAKAAQYLADNR